MFSSTSPGTLRFVTVLSQRAQAGGWATNEGYSQCTAATKPRLGMKCRSLPIRQGRATGKILRRDLEARSDQQAAVESAFFNVPVHPCHSTARSGPRKGHHVTLQFQ